MRKTKEQKAITLIALIITIVVLLILAVVAINAVTGDGIIQHATNAKTEYEKAQDREKDMLSYYEGVLETGEVVPTVEQLQEKYSSSFTYFSSLSRAIGNINGTENTGADITKENSENAVAGIYADGENNKYVVLMKDTEESTTININQSVTMNLGGNTLTFNAKDNTVVSGISTSTGVEKVTIDGRLKGSSIIFNSSDAGMTAILSNANNFNITGGTYNVNANNGHSTVFGGIYGKLNISGCEINNNSNTGTGYAIISVNTANTTTVTNCIINTTSIKNYSVGIEIYNKFIIENCKIKASSDENNAYGIETRADTELVIKDSDIFGDASSNNNEYPGSYGILNGGGIVKAYSCNLKGTFCAMYASENAKNYIYNSTLSGQGSFGYMAHHGINGKTYMENTTIMCGEYEGEFDYSNFTSTKGIAMHVGGVTGDKTSYNNVYMNNCKVIGADTAMKIDTGTDNTVNMSNCEITGTVEVTSGQILNLGEGMNKSNLNITGSGTVNKTGLNYKGNDN